METQDLQQRLCSVYFPIFLQIITFSHDPGFMDILYNAEIWTSQTDG
jgi:hypothetical protein